MTTIQDIADKMGISKSAVSKALNIAPDISENLRKQVLETAVALGYKSYGVIEILSEKYVS